MDNISRDSLMKIIIAPLRTLLLSLVFLGILLGGAEALARSPTVQSYFLPPAVGKHEDLGPKLQQLDAIIRQEGTIDCIFLGDSTVYEGIDPEAFSASYQQVTKMPITCYNFGLDGLGVADIATIARILTEDYDPWLILYGSGPQSYVHRDRDLVEDNDRWVQYRTGHFSFEGWLTDQSYAYRLYLPHRSWMNPDYPSKRVRHQVFMEFTTPYGFFYYPSEDINGYDVSGTPDPGIYGGWYQMLTEYHIEENYIADLQSIIALQTQNIQVILFEMPVAPTFYTFFEHGQDDYQIFLDYVGETAASTDTIFIRTVSDGWEVPANGWSDYAHPNIYGAADLSQWLGQQVGEQVLQGVIETQEP